MGSVSEEFNKIMHEMLAEDPALLELVRDISAKRNPKTHQPIRFDLKPGQHMYNYYRGKNGHLECFSPHPDTEGNFWCWTLVPQGKGARTGKANTWRTTRLVRCAKAKTAKAKACHRAQQSYENIENRVYAEQPISQEG